MGAEVHIQLEADKSKSKPWTVNYKKVGRTAGMVDQESSTKPQECRQLPDRSSSAQFAKE